MTSPLTYSLAEASERLGGPFTVDFLKGHLAELPHIKTGAGRGRGGRVAFSEQHLIRIVDMFSVQPREIPVEEFPGMATRRGRRPAAERRSA